jgi:hypothetical protein
MAGTVIIPWYATGFRHDTFAQALSEIAAVAQRYGAASWEVYRSRDDRYRFQQLATFADHYDWERYWEGREMTEFRARHSGWYQVPVLYGWWDRVAAGGLGAGAQEGFARAGAADGEGNGAVGDML